MIRAMADARYIDFTPVGDRVRLRSQVRFRPPKQSAAVMAVLRAGGHAQVLWERDDDYVISWPSEHDGMGVVEVVQVETLSAALNEAHRTHVHGFVFVLGGEIVDRNELEATPDRSLWLRE